MTPRQNLFVAEYALSRNATSAAVRAGYSPRTARQMGSESLTKPDIRAAVAEHERKTARAAIAVLVKFIPSVWLMLFSSTLEMAVRCPHGAPLRVN